MLHYSKDCDVALIVDFDDILAYMPVCYTAYFSVGLEFSFFIFHFSFFIFHFSFFNLSFFHS